MTHTLEVEQIATSVASALKLNTDLVSAIALGHDVGHAFYGKEIFLYIKINRKKG